MGFAGIVLPLEADPIARVALGATLIGLYGEGGRSRSSSQKRGRDGTHEAKERGAVFLREIQKMPDLTG